ncbi:MAG: nicotinate-nucleotide--dimethylbenzimidazole phosphoribosyltransferase [Mesorhizobium sp.]|nr:nicotinate-nucleotide--dimethylbenzimidazole phosphoribosyltransferase [Mesorhizobium sp.]
MATEHPLDDFRGLLAGIQGPDEAAGQRVAQVFARAGQDRSSLSEGAEWLSRWSGRPPAVNRPSVALFAGTHGVTANGISQRAVQATAETVAACGAGEAAINHLGAAHQLGLKVYDLALHLPTGNISAEAAMDERTCAATMAFGMEAIAGGTDLILVGSIRSTGDETVAAALLTALLGGAAADWLPTEADAELTSRRVVTIETALARHRGKLGDPFDTLRHVGGREFAAMAGCILAARIERIPVILDGMTALAAGAVLAAGHPGGLAHCLLAEASGQAAMRASARLGLPPILPDGVSAGEGTAAAVATGILRDAVALHAGFAAHARIMQ